MICAESLNYIGTEPSVYNEFIELPLNSSFVCFQLRKEVEVASNVSVSAQDLSWRYKLNKVKELAEAFAAFVLKLTVIVTLVVFVIIGVISCYCAKRARRAITQELQTAVRAASTNTQYTNTPHNAVQVWEVIAPTMENFLQEMAREKPVRFIAQQLYSFTSNYSTRLGSGDFGVVYKGQFPNGMRIAVKVLTWSVDKRAEEQFMAEVGIIGRTYLINLVRLYGFCHDQYMSALVYEFMENGSLDKGLAYLHEECQQRIIHYDIKPGNILLDENFFPRVGDFGLTKLGNRDNTHVTLTGYRGTPGYSAPEFLLKNHPITHKCDVYSFGMVLFVIIGRRKNTIVGPGGSLDWFPKHVWDAYEKDELNIMTVACGIEEKDREKVERMSKVALWCVQDSPEGRAPMSAVVKMLEGGVEIVPPPKPFQYLFSVGMTALNPLETSDGSSYTTSEESQSRWYKEITPIMAKYEIQMASSA
ncbi:LOW QUALITY PROTEIN: rust resistance kinase Lr10-like [Pistacia vera]|uniref:LOW QUALITY PROTEIN: rust resistance kinase Lr10-like n=1 Tax=Pistacia vera TaxID=55513 RepID=UPI001262CFEF|nr:LOW QUALITY PROTEIN: rust resistance kinase Lr10-like [Pistacia vera]